MSAARELGIVPQWPAPAGVRAFSTTRGGGVSHAPYASLNLARHVGDRPGAVADNRARLRNALGLAAEPRWLRQVHGTRVADAAEGGGPPQADAAVAGGPGVVCAVLTADCLPVLLCDRAGSRVGVAHAGWRGLAAGVLEAVVGALDRAPVDLMAWLGPAIGPGRFEVGDEVRDGFLGRDAGAYSAFRRGAPGRWYADLYALARRRLAACGVDAVYGGGWCTAGDPERFFSYRRDGVTGRMATLIWLAA